MFLGNFKHTIDSKGRLSIPVRFREQINVHSHGQVVLTSDLDPCLVVYTLSEWESLLEKIKTLPIMDKSVKDFRRLLFSRASECSLDKQGRVLIPQKLRDHARLERDTYVIGNDKKFEIWNPDRWDEAESNALSGAEKIQDALATLGM